MTHYYAAFTDTDCIIGCEHKHKTVLSATACIQAAGGYVVAVTRGRPRALNQKEEALFQKALSGMGLKRTPQDYTMYLLLISRLTSN